MKKNILSNCRFLFTVPSPLKYLSLYYYYYYYYDYYYYYYFTFLSFSSTFHQNFPCTLYIHAYVRARECVRACICVSAHASRCDVRPLYPPVKTSFIIGPVSDFFTRVSIQNRRIFSFNVRKIYICRSILLPRNCSLDVS